MVLDETGLFGSSIRLNFEEDRTWEHCTRQLENGASSITYPCTAMESPVGAYLPSELYFGDGRRNETTIALAAVTGDILSAAECVLVPSRTDWTLFNDVAEHWECAQVVLYESLEKPAAACLLRIDVAGTPFIVSTIDYRNLSEKAIALWKKILSAEGLHTDAVSASRPQESRMFNLLLDGPVD